jgi:hypothetical protein
MAIVTIKIRRGLAAEWASENPVLAEGELGLELDTLRIKVGDGAQYWNDLAYGTPGEIHVGPTPPADPFINKIWIQT